jgi:hypothetical protein
MLSLLMNATERNEGISSKTVIESEVRRTLFPDSLVLRRNEDEPACTDNYRSYIQKTTYRTI